MATITLDISQAPIYLPVYGYLYNWYAVTDVRNIANIGWHVPTLTELQTLRAFLDPGGSDTINIAGGKMKEVGETYWTSNFGATNESNFNGRGGGYRTNSGVFQSIKTQSTFPSTTVAFAGFHRIGTIFTSNTNLVVSTSTSRNDKYGDSVRLIKDSTTLVNGEEGTYVSNDNKLYRTICIGTQEWLADNLAETLYRNGDPIPTVTNAVDWSNLTTGAKCAYNNDINNV